jgi:hypothetical protein
MGRTMRARRLVVFLTALLAACGGSGSSGFDVAPGLEATLIGRAIAENRCVEGDGLLICPSGVPAPGPDNGMNAPGPSEVRVEAGFAGEVECSTGGSCTLPVSVSTDGLPEGAQIRVAVRASGADVWQVGAPIEVQSSSGGGGTVTPVDVELAGESTPGSEAQVAVLVFLPPLGPVPTEVTELRETGASYAFVLPPVALTPGASS